LEEELEEEQNNSELLKDHYRKLVLQVGVAGIPCQPDPPLPHPSLQELSDSLDMKTFDVGFHKVRKT
jgi:hypothetical protein